MSDISNKDMANAIRALSMDAIQKANSGHPGMPMGMADAATVLFSKFLKFNPQDHNWPDRDRFVLSAGHGSMLIYSLLYLTGYPGMSMEDIKNFRQLGAKTAGHPEYGHVDGVETTTGPLGQGIATAVGMALAERMLNARHGDDIVDHYTYVIAGDGCLMEGISHEAISLAGHLKLGKLVVLWDDNNITIDGEVGVSCSDDQLKRFEASGWDTTRVDGHDPAAVEAAIAAARQSSTPSLIACKTIIGYGSPNKQGTAATHGAPLGDDEIAATRKAIGWSTGPFEVPDDILTAWREVGARSKADYDAWSSRAAGMDADARARLGDPIDDKAMAAIRNTVSEVKAKFSAEEPKLATRVSNKQVLEALVPVIPGVVGGSADLTGSNGCITSHSSAVTASDYSGNYMHYGVREFGMGTTMNGMALHGGLVPYSGTFLVFADYSRPAIRLSALMGVRVIHVLTHDSIGLGEDGPTHQPVETVASLRAMPNLNVFRPADAVEVAECWEVALSTPATPSAMAMTRQNLPTFRVAHTEENKSAKGAYVILEPEGGRDVTLLATGSEVEIALAGAGILDNQGIKAAVVSMPCWELFEVQDDAYKAAVLGDKPRVGVEAALRFGWDRWLGENGAFVGMKSFGASAPANDLYKHFGITAEKVAEAAKTLI
jgi:transketolase